MLRYKLPVGIAALLLVLAAAFLFRPIHIQDEDHIYSLGAFQHAPMLKTGQVLEAAGLHLSPDDQVEPPLDSPVALDGEIHIRRAIRVRLWEAGQLQEIRTFGRTPAEVLKSAGISLSATDRLLRAGLVLDLKAPLSPGNTEVWQIERPVPFDVLVDGQTKHILTFASTVAGALWDAGIILSPGDWLSSPPGEVLTKMGEKVALQRATPVLIQVEGHIIRASSAAATVGQALAESAVSLQGLDYSLPAEEQPLPADGVIRVVRVREELIFEQTLTPFDSKTQPDSEIELDQRKVVQAGQYGLKVNRYRVRYEDGQEVSRALDAGWTASEPQSQIVGVGTKAVPHTLDTPDGTIEYWRAVTVYATAYSPCRLGTPDHCSDTTASGAKLTKGIIAVSQSWYGLMAGQRVYIPGYGFAVIADTGGGIPGRRWIDLGYDDSNYVGGARTVTLYFLTPIPENVPWTLP